ncbi:MAG: hypothetical protein Q8N21_03125 [bacterium]|nr:hypothetical protein [bacterium]
MNPQFDPKTIETLKAARNQVVQVNKVRENFSNGASNKFAEEFVQKLASIERETAAVDEEIVKMEKIWLNLIEKKKQLENRRNELSKVKDKLKELDKEMSDALKSQSV